MAKRVALAVFAQLVEFRAFAPTSLAVDSGTLDARGGIRQMAPAQEREFREHPYGFRLPEHQASPPEAGGGIDQDLHAREFVVAAQGGAQTLRG